MLMLGRVISRMPAFRAMLALVVTTGILVWWHYQKKALAWTARTH